ncbi:MAG TPA: 30S ribosomal protein S4 [Candidatus Paceibacterota bacterium]|nr:30S ribosomal protein S4 [Candidatus Paceibacterota bacterium]
MLLVKSQYKIAKRLGAGIFEKTQSQKFSLSEARTKKPRGRAVSDYGRQLLEKQKVRFTFGLSERQLSNYAHTAFKEKDPSAALHSALETRADSLVYRAGFASTRRAARQIVSHGHILINGVRITTPSHRVRTGDVISVREGSRTSPLFAALAEVNPESGRAIPSWISADPKLLRIEIKGEPTYTSVDSGLDYPTVFEFYSR